MEKSDFVDLLDTPLPLDDRLVYGQLKNGLSFYIRQNQKPENRAEIRLVVKAGSVLEDEKQLGLAHIVEHMAFNGTKRFQPGEIVSYFESIGSRFGAHLNAYTSFDETVYKLNVPTQQDGVLKRSLELLRDWAADLTFVPKEIERERKVGLEELRQGRNAMKRVQDQLLPKLFYGSKYVDRRPIGTVESLENFEHKDLIRFYKTWYRAELMAVIVVGDVDPKQVQNIIEEEFHDLVSDSEAPLREYEILELHDECFYDVFCDSEIPQSSLSLMAKRRESKGVLHKDYRKHLIQDLALSGFNERLTIQTQQPDCPFSMAMAHVQDLNINTVADSVVMVVREARFEECTRSLYRALERVRRFGLSAHELERAKKSIRSSISTTYEERDKTSSLRMCSELIRAFTTGESVPGIEYEYQIVNAFLESISLDEVNDFLCAWLSASSQLMNVVTGEEQPPSVEDLKAWSQNNDFLDLVPPETESNLAPLLSEFPPKGSIIDRVNLEGTEIDELLLSNGAKVWLKTTNFQKDQVLFSHFQRGGRSLLVDEDCFAANLAVPLLGHSGAGGHSLLDLYRINAGKTLSVKPHISQTSHGFNGSCRNEYLEDLFQLHTLKDRQPAFDPKMYEEMIKINREHIRTKNADPRTVFHEESLKVWWNNHPRYIPATFESFDSVSFDKVTRIYKDLFAPTSGRHYVFVGNLEENRLLPMIERYLAVESDAPARELIYREDPRVTSPIKHRIYQGSEELAFYDFTSMKLISSTPKTRLQAKILGELLNIRLRRKFREERGDVYSIHARQSLSTYPKEAFIYSIAFSCDPQKYDELVSLLHQEIEAFYQEVDPLGDLDNIKLQFQNGYEVGLKENKQWIKSLTTHLRRKQHPNGIFSFPERLNSIQKSDLQIEARNWLNLERSVELSMFPKKND